MGLNSNYSLMFNLSRVTAPACLRCTVFLLHEHFIQVKHLNYNLASTSSQANHLVQAKHLKYANHLKQAKHLKHVKYLMHVKNLKQAKHFNCN